MKKTYKKNSIQTRLLTWFCGELMGEDPNGNKYYQEKVMFGKFNRPMRRWVLYNGTPDPTTIPAVWFGWMHFTNEEPLLEYRHLPWQKDHQPNLTGTPGAYRPDMTENNRSIAKKPLKRYEPWKPTH